MSSSITVRDIDPADKSWLKREARQVGVSMEEFVRRPDPGEAYEDRAPSEAVRGLRATFWYAARGRTAATGALRLQAAVVLQ